MTPTADPVLAAITDYIAAPPPFSELAYRTARMSLLDSLGCALLALDAPECRRLLGPLAAPPPGPGRALIRRHPGSGHATDARVPASAPNAEPSPAGASPAAQAPPTRAPGVVRVPGTGLAADPVTAAFNTGAPDPLARL